MLVSIIIPIYNTEKFLAESLQSALDQTYPDIEIILIDDASSDTSPIIIEKFKKQYPEMIHVIIHKENSGVTIARKNGFLASHGEYIYFLDSDDRMYPDSIERLIHGSKDTDALVVIGHRDRIDEGSEVIKNDRSARWEKIIISNIGRELMTHNPLTPGNLLISRSILYPTDFNTSKVYGEDWILFVCLAHRSSFFCISGKPVYSYRMHPDQQTNGKVRFSKWKKSIPLIYQNPGVKKCYSSWELIPLKYIAYIKCWLWCMDLKYTYIRKIYIFLSHFILREKERIKTTMSVYPEKTLDTSMKIDLMKITKPDILFEKK